MDEFISLHSISTDPCFSLLALCKSLPSLSKIHAQLIVHGLSCHLLFQTKLVSMYGSFGHTALARSVFDQIPRPDLYSFKVMIRWYFLNDSYAYIIPFHTRMRQFLIEHDNVVFSIVLKACAELRDLSEGAKLHCSVVKAGSPDGFVLTGLIDMYAKCGCLGSAHQMFDETPDRNVVAWTSLISGYIQNERAADGLLLFNQMRQVSVEPNQFTMGSLLTACTKLDALSQAQWVHGLMIKTGVDFNSFLVTALLDVYVKCGSVGDARCVFDELCTVDLVSWTAMIVGYAQRCIPVEGLKLFRHKEWAGLIPNSITLASVLSSCAQLCHLNFGRLVHGLGFKLGLEQDATVRNALIDMYAKCHMIGEASYIFKSTLHMDLITWNAMIAGYLQNGLDCDALLLFRCMQLNCLSPDAVTLVTVLSACASIGAQNIGSSLHSCAVKVGCVSNVYVGTSLLNFYAKCGDVEAARIIFDGMGERNAVTWSAMMGGYGMHGDATGSLSIFSNMLKEDLKPNDVMFTCILSACGHTGMVGEGLKYFTDMDQEYCVIPSMKHYVCVVDLLARAGKIDDAWHFIENMPIRADVSVWGALLHGCRVHSRMDIGEVAARGMLELQPENAAYYVLVSNLYASAGKWDEAFKVRELMKERGLNKFPGCSSIDTDATLRSLAMATSP